MVVFKCLLHVSCHSSFMYVISNLLVLNVLFFTDYESFMKTPNYLKLINELSIAKSAI